MCDKEEKMVVVDFSEEWSFTNRIEKLIDGARASADEIIRSLHKEMDLIDLKEEKYKAATEGRLFAIKAASEIMAEIDRLNESLIKSSDDNFRIEEDKEFSSGFAERYAKKKK